MTRSKRERPAVCIDVGNTNVKIELAGRGDIERVSVERTAVRATAGRLARTLRGIARSSPEGVDVIVCSVVPSVGRTLIKTVRDTLGVTPFEIRSSCRLPIQLAVEHPEKVGPDRICAAVGGLAGRSAGWTRPTILVDVGSAVTVDLVDRGAFRGGLIFTGPAMGLQALGAYARRLPVVNPGKIAESTPARFSNTESAMVLGAQISTVGAIKEGVRSLARTTGRRPAVVVTGGWAAAMLPHLPKRWRYDPHLVSRGMIEIHRFNR